MDSKKNFISLSFTPKKLQFLQLNAAKTAVISYGSVPLPEGLISNYKVTDKNVLIKILKDIWQKFHLKEKKVGIIIPEFSAFSKNITLPLLDAKELDEAVRWQAQDFLPLPLDQTVLDWRIIQKDKNNCQILVIAMPKEILITFVDTVGEAELLPVVVETPSLALSRIADSKKFGRLIIYINSEEAILVLSYGEEIIGSSVVNAADYEGILWTAVNMSRHYKDTQIEVLEIGGLKFTEQLLTNLQKEINKPINWIIPKVAGLSSEQIQEYLLPLALQFKDPAEPANELTINLLPDTWVEKYQKIKFEKQSSILLTLVTVVIWSCFLSVLGFYLWLFIQINQLKKAVERVPSISEETKTKLETINQMTAKILTIKTAMIQPQEIINALFKAKPSGVFFSAYKLDLDKGKINLKGKADNRSALLKFKQSLEENKNFEKVTLPLTVLETEKDIDFEINLSWQTAKGGQNLTIPIK